MKGRVGLHVLNETLSERGAIVAKVRSEPAEETTELKNYLHIISSSIFCSHRDCFFSMQTVMWEDAQRSPVGQVRMKDWHPPLSDLLLPLHCTVVLEISNYGKSYNRKLVQRMQ
jgi:hypothetical protein